MASRLTHTEFDKRVTMAMQPQAGAKAPATVGNLLAKMKQRGKAPAISS